MSVPPSSVSGCPPLGSIYASSNDAFGRICGYAKESDLDKRETATVLSIAHLTGWSAELIANRVHEYLGTSITAEKVWDTYKEWEDARNETWLSSPTWEDELKTTKDMVCMLNQHEIKPDFRARPLSQTPRPVSIHFSSIWYPHNDNSIILDNFTEKTRVACIRALLWRREESRLANPTSEELHVINKLGQYVATIIMELLPCWLDEQMKMNEKLSFTRAIEVSLENVQIIEKYIRLFKHKWEDVFGKMDGTDMVWLPLHEQPPFYHSLSTGDAVMKFFRLMLLTRLQAMEQRRLAWREIIGFKKISMKKLPEDVKDCYICQQPLGVLDEDGEMEMPIQVVACCGNYFGGNCLRKWYGEFENTKCPLCKWAASTTFLEKLFDSTEDANYDDDDLDQEPATAQIGSARAPSPDVNDNLEGRETDIDRYSLEYGADFDNSNDELEDGEIKE